MRRLGVTLGTLFGLLLVVAIASPALADPPGNNGDIKIEFSGTLPPNMEPHVPCTFNIEFYNYDEGDLYGDYSFALQPPTGTSTLLSGSTFIGEDAAGGGTDLDASVAIDLGPYLSGVTPHPIQGYHVKVTVHADGSIGADTKYKVFWVKCGPSYVPGPTATGDTLNAASNSPTASRPDWGIVGLMVVLFGTPAFLVARRIRRMAKAR